MYVLIIISLIFFGLVFGSFGSVIFYRLGDWPTKKIWKGFLVGRSECPKCHHTLKVRNLIPIFSRLFQGGKCEYCKKPISWFYPFLEITSVIIFLSVFIILSKYGIPNHSVGLGEGYIYMIFIAISAWLLWIIFLYDIKTYNLHITAALFFIIISLFFTLFFGNNRLDILLGMGIFVLIFLFVYCLGILVATIKFGEKTEGFGLGDVIIAPILGAWLVFFIQPNGMFEWYYLFIFFILLCGIIGIFYSVLDFIIRKIIIKKRRKKTKEVSNIGFPFLPSMIISTVLEVVFWDQLIYIGNLFGDWFMNLLYF